MFTDTGRLSELLDQAEQRWPYESDRKELMMKLVERGAEADAQSAAERREAIRQTAGMLTGVYPPNALEELRRDWPD